MSPLYACQLALALASEIPTLSEPFNSALNKMIFNLSPLSLGLEKENQGACHTPFLNYLFLIIVTSVHYYYYYPPFSLAPPHFRLAWAVRAVALDEEKEESGRIESLMQGQSTSGN